MIPNFHEENDAQRARLFALIDRLDEVSLARKLPNGWTVAAALAHLAFWDLYAKALLEEWARTGFRLPVSEIDAINEAIEGMSLPIPTPALLAWVRESAEASDRAAASAPQKLASIVVAAGKSTYLLRATHRRHHLDQIEKLLGTV